MATWRKPHTLKPDFSKQNLPDFPATKFFDHLSFVGNELVSCFILETAKGYVLLDCMGYTSKMKHLVESISGKIVILPRTLSASIVQVLIS